MPPAPPSGAGSCARARVRPERAAPARRGHRPAFACGGEWEWSSARGRTPPGGYAERYVMTGSRARFRVGVDIGGTFTDAVLLSESGGATRIAKVPSTPSDPSQGFLVAVERILSGRRRRTGGRLVPGARHHRRHQLDHRRQDAPHRVHHHRGLPRHARDWPPGAADALRRPLREGAAAGAAKSLLRGQGAARCSRRRCWSRSTKPRVHEIARKLVGTGRRLRRRLSAPRLPEPRPRAAHRRAAAQPTTGTSSSRSRPTCVPSSGSTSAPAPPSSTRACVRCWPATSRTSRAGCAGAG